MHYSIPRLLTALVVAAPAAGLVARVDAQAPAAAQEIDALLRANHAIDTLNGTAIVVHQGELVYKGAFGFANFEWKVPNTPDTKFRLASITKQFTATLILQQVQAGKMALDAPIRSYLPDYPKPSGDKVTIHHLLNHTSGIPSYTQLPGFMQNKVRDRYEVTDFVEKYCSSPLKFEPGSKFEYNNSAYFLLGAILEAVTGKTYAELLRSEIFEVCGMKNSGYADAMRVIEKRAKGYERVADTVTVAPWIDMTIPYAAGSIYSTVEDLMLWDRALHGTKILNDKLKSKMFGSDQEDGRGYAYGWQWRTNAKGQRVVSHGGGIFGFNTTIVRVPATKTCIAILNNTGGTDLGSMTKGIFDILEGRKWKRPEMRPDFALAKTLLSDGIDAAITMHGAYPTHVRTRLEGPLNNLGYQLLGLTRIDDAIRVFRFNTRAFPKSANTWDSLGEAYLAAGKREKSIANYEQALKVDPNLESAKAMLDKIRTRNN